MCVKWSLAENDCGNRCEKSNSGNVGAPGHRRKALQQEVPPTWQPSSGTAGTTLRTARVREGSEWKNLSKGRKSIVNNHPT